MLVLGLCTGIVMAFVFPAIVGALVQEKVVTPVLANGRFSFSPFLTTPST